MKRGTHKLQKLSSIKNRILPILRRSGVSRAAIFGSYARGDNDRHSDLDLLISFGNSRRTILHLIAIQNELKHTLGIGVDVITYRSIYPPLRPAILRDSVTIL